MANRLEILEAWAQAHARTEEAYEVLKKFGVNIDAPIADLIWKMFDEATKLASLALLGHPPTVNCPLSWYCWDNNMGAKELEAGPTGNTRPIRTLEDLLWLIDGEAKD